MPFLEKQNWSDWGYILKEKLEPLRVNILIPPVSLHLNKVLGSGQVLLSYMDKPS